jgi:adenylate kinase family enzyme
MEFPIFKTKVEGVTQKFDLTEPEERKIYFQQKAGKEIAKLRSYLKRNSFIAYLLGKKSAGKGTYSKMFREVVDKEKIAHFSVGDMTREVDQELRDKQKRKELVSFLEKNYRGPLSLNKVIALHENRNTSTLLPTEWILALAKRGIMKQSGKTIFIDGFPRNLDQISYSLFFRDLIGHRQDPDIFILISVPENVIDQRMKYRVICPQCKTPRNLKVTATKKAGYDEKTKEFYLICDNPECGGARMVSKEGDEQGTKAIRERLELDGKIIKEAASFYGVPKIFLRNSIPVSIASEFVDDYEITPEYYYQWDSKAKKVKILTRPWTVKDDREVPSYSLLPAAVVLSMIKQMANLLDL